MRCRASDLPRSRAARAVIVVPLIVVLATLLVSQAPATALVPTVTVTPSTGLVDGQPVTIDLAGFSANTSVSIVECPATATAQNECAALEPATPRTDATGAVSFSYSVTRVIFTLFLGRVDCAQTACVIGAAEAPGFTLNATAAVTFVDTPLPPPPFSITLEEPHFMNASPRLEPQGLATFGARLTCDRAAQVNVTAFIDQRASGGSNAVALSSYPCAAGADLHIFSDYLIGRSGAAHATMVISVNGKDVGAALGDVTLQSEPETAAALAAALSGPDGDAVRAKLIDDLRWRLTYNNTFRNVWVCATNPDICQP